jgi:YbbR domain-containing protein
VRVTVEVTSDEAIEQVLVSPSVDRLSLPSDYIFLGIEDFSPKTVSVTGDKDALDALPVEVETETIDLSQATGNFTAEVGVVLPEGVTLAEPEQKITVTLLVEAREDLKQLNDIPVEVRGGSVSTVVRVVPDEVTVLVRGPQPVLRELTEADVQVVVDVQGLAEGNHDLVPTVMVDNADIVPGDVSVLPNRIGVSIEDTQTNTPSVTPTTQSEATPQS